MFCVLEIVFNTTFRITLNEAIESNIKRIKIKKLNMEKPHHISVEDICTFAVFVINFYLSHTQVYCVVEFWMKGLCIYCCAHIAFAFIYGLFWLIFFLCILWNICNYQLYGTIFYYKFYSQGRSINMVIAPEYIVSLKRFFCLKLRNDFSSALWRCDV